MKHVGVQDRPREKLERAGAESLGDNELVAVLVGHGTAHEGALAIADRVLAVVDGARGLTRVQHTDLSAVPGIGRAVAARILAAVELGRRTLTATSDVRPRLTTPHEVARFLLPQFGAAPVERFGVLLLDVRHRPIRVRLLTSGSREASLVHPREVFREAVVAGASAIVVFHNHPSGDATPSVDDLKLTRRLVVVGRFMGIDVVDHLVLADDRYTSLKRMGHL
jgi:DNA repair protein RadC